MTTEPTTGERCASYGAWPSPLEAAWVATGDLQLSMGRIHDGIPYWIERRPTGDGSALMSVRDGAATEVLPDGWHPGSGVHETYSGTTYTVTAHGVHFVNKGDQRLCRFDPASGEVTALTSSDTSAGGTGDSAGTGSSGDSSRLRLVDPVVDETHQRVLCVAERHRDDQGPAGPVNLVVDVPLAGGPVREIVSGADFYSGVRPSPDGAHLCWISWSHPNMPWNGTELWVGRLGADGGLDPDEAPVLVAGAADVSIASPEWDADGTLWFVGDGTGWWNLYRFTPEVDDAPRLLVAVDADCTRPPWEVGHRSFVPTGPDEALVILRREGRIELARLTGEGATVVPTDFVEFLELARDTAGSGEVVTVAGESRRTQSVLAIDPAGLVVRTLHHDDTVDPPPGLLSAAEPITYPTGEGEVAHGYYYAPTLEGWSGPEGERPPLLITVHGGPTSAAKPSLNPTIQFFTSRGFAVVDLNYRGSTGFGRAFWQRLYGQWGVTDVQDCEGASRFLAERGDSDPDRVAVRGGSAGGFTALAALAFSDRFRAGVSYYGVSDLALMEQETHKFESRYTSRLTHGDDGDPELLVTRSPMHAADRISDPVLFLQGADDPVVPRNQSQLMFDRLVERGVPTAYLEFEGESHGFRRAETVRRSLEAEMAFYATVFGFERDDLHPLDVVNAPG